MKMKRSVRVEEVNQFARDLGVMLGSGIGILKALEILGKRAGGIGEVGQGIWEVVRGGNSLSMGMLNYPEVFDLHFVSMVKAGEASGDVPEVLKRVAERREKAMGVRKRIRAAMIYPMTVMSVASVLVMGLVMFVVPRFEVMYGEVLKDQRMPVVTEWVVGISRWVTGNFGLVLILMMLVGLGGWLMGKRKGMWDGLMMKLPKVGKLVMKYNVGQFTRAMGELLGNGVAMLEGLVVARGVINNRVIEGRMDAVFAMVKEGNPLSKGLEVEGKYPEMVVQMIGVGEQSGTLPEVLERVASSYDEEIERELLELSAKVEPLMVVGMAVVIGIIVVALFLPIVGMLEGLSMF